MSCWFVMSPINLSLGNLDAPCSQGFTLCLASQKSIGKNFLFGRTDSSWSVALMDHLGRRHLHTQKCILSAPGYRSTPARHLANMYCWLTNRWEYGEWGYLAFWKRRAHWVVPSHTRMLWLYCHVLLAVYFSLFLLSLLFCFLFLLRPYNNPVK